jgi:hypothetical protein
MTDDYWYQQRYDDMFYATHSRMPGERPSRVEIDPNVRIGRTITFSGFDDCDRVPSVGEPVVVYESEAGIEGPAVCSGIDEAKRLVYLDVDWARLAATDTLFLIWSHKHGMWWRAREVGYTRRFILAGCYTHADAQRISERSCYAWLRGLPTPGDLPPSVVIPFSTALNEVEAAASVADATQAAVDERGPVPRS